VSETGDNSIFAGAVNEFIDVIGLLLLLLNMSIECLIAINLSHLRDYYYDWDT